MLSTLHSENGWYSMCSTCFKVPEDTSLPTSASVELGFGKPRIERPKGVSSASSFTWAQNPVQVRQMCERHMEEELIVDEYGRKLTCREFLLMLRMNCPIEFTQAIGECFN